jgi:UDP-N-acetylmuramoyl-tripeptide--D-alanyl-D-alanine ligase
MAAAAAALVQLPGGRAIAVLGTMAELGPRSAAIHRETGGVLRELGVDVLVTVGEPARELANGFDAAGGEAHHCADPAAAAGWLQAHARPGDRILIKGSRAAGMERVLASIGDEGAGEGPPA